MKKTNGYTVDFANNTITLTKAFAQRAKSPASAEFRELAKLHKNFPDFTIAMRTAVITADNADSVSLGCFHPIKQEYS